MGTGGPLFAPSYLGDLGGIPARMHLLHLCGTGRSGPADPADLRFDLHVDDVEAVSGAESRSDEPWYPAVKDALEAVLAGGFATRDRAALAPFFYGRWDDVTQAHARASDAMRLPDAPAAYYAAGAPVASPEELAGLDVPALLLAGGVDALPSPAAVEEAARLFPRSSVVVQPAAGHYPWLDDPEFFRGAVAEFLA